MFNSNTFYILASISIRLGNLFGITPMIWDSKKGLTKVSKCRLVYWRCYYIFFITLTNAIFLLYQLWKVKLSPVYLSLVLVYLIYTLIVLLGISLLIMVPEKSSGVLNALLTYLKNYSGKLFM